MDPEFLKALELVAEYDRSRPTVVKEFRLYYNDDGSIIGLWETDHPSGDYIVLSNPDIFHCTNTHSLRVVNRELKIIDHTMPFKTRLIKSLTGQPVVTGHAALALNTNDEYQEIEYYDRKTNN